MKPDRPYDRWTRAEMDIFEAAWKKGGMAAAQAALPHRTNSSLRGKAHALSVHIDGRKPYQKNAPADYEWIDAALRRAYRDGEPNLVQLALQLKRGRGFLKDRAIFLGLAHRAKAEPPWTDAEHALLESLIERGYSARIIYKRMKEAGYSRTLGAIVSRVSATKLTWNRGFLTAADVATLFGVNDKTALAWLRAGQLKGKRGAGPSSLREVADERLLWQVRYDDIAPFMLANPHCWDHRKMRQEVLLDLLRPGQLNRIARQEMA